MEDAIRARQAFPDDDDSNSESTAPPASTTTADIQEAATVTTVSAVTATNSGKDVAAAQLRSPSSSLPESETNERGLAPEDESVDYESVHVLVSRSDAEEAGACAAQPSLLFLIALAGHRDACRADIILPTSLRF